MKDIQQLIKKSNEVGRYDNVFPKTFIDAIKDRETGVSLRDILSSFNMYFLTYMGSPEDTRLQLPKSLRRMGVWITYVTWDNTVHIEWYSSDDISDETFRSSLYWKEGTNSLVGDLSISSEGNWVINREDTGIPARGEKGITPVLRLGKNNRFQVSYNEGGSYSDITSEPIITQLRVHNNKLQKSLDLGKTWEDESDYISSYFREKDNKIQISKDKETWEDISDNIAAWFRFKTEKGQSQNNSVGKIQISRDERNSWQDLSSDFTNRLHIKGYVKTKEELPEAVQGDIYGVGPIFEEEDTEKINPIYTLYVFSDGNWINNGRYTSIDAGVVQELGNSETELISQKVTTTSLAKINNLSTINPTYTKEFRTDVKNTLQYLGVSFIPDREYIIEIKPKDGGVVSYNIRGYLEDGSYNTIFGETIKEDRIHTISNSSYYHNIAMYFGNDTTSKNIDIVVKVKNTDSIYNDNNTTIYDKFYINDLAGDISSIKSNIYSRRKKINNSNIKFPIHYNLIKDKLYKFEFDNFNNNQYEMHLRCIYIDDSVGNISSISPTIISNREINFIPIKEIKYLYLYVGQNTKINPPLEFDLKIKEVKFDFNLDHSYKSNNLFPSSMFLEGTLDGIKENNKDIKQISKGGDITFNNNNIIIPSGGYVFFFLDEENLTINSRFFNGLSNIDCDKENAVIAIASDPTIKDTYNSRKKFTFNSNNEVVLQKQELKQGLSKDIRIDFDNRKGNSPMTIYNIFLWESNGKLEVPNFNSLDIYKLKNRIGEVNSNIGTPISLNYAPNYLKWNKYVVDSLYREEDYLKVVFNPKKIYFGFEVLLSETTLEENEDFYYTIENFLAEKNTKIITIYYNKEEKEIGRKEFYFDDFNEEKTYYNIKNTVKPGTHKILIRFQIGISVEFDTYLMEVGKFHIHKNLFIKDSVEIDKPWINGNNEETDILLNKTIYVDVNSGDDSNEGNEDFPLKTIKKALEISSANASIILREGDYYEDINIRGLNKVSLEVKAYYGEYVRLLGGKFINSATKVSENIFKKSLDSLNTNSKLELFQHDIEDLSTLISEDERHPLQRGRKYRCLSTKLDRGTSIKEVEDSTDASPKFYYDEENKELYFRVRSDSSLSLNPLVIPEGSLFSGNTGNTQVTLLGINMLYGVCSIIRSPNAKLIDCSSSYGRGGGCFSYDMSTGIEFIRCEAARAHTGSGTGDGFNGHSSELTSHLPKYTTATFIDCWSHDCADDGYSNHEGCESTFIGGLFEYCGKGALTPAYGAHDTYNGCFVRKSNYGIGLVGGAVDGGEGSQVIAYNCISEDNKTNYYVQGDGRTDLVNTMILKDCISRNGNVGYSAGSTGYIMAYNCFEDGSNKSKEGKVKIINTKLLE